MDRINPDVLSVIIQNLHDPRDIISLANTNRYFQHYVPMCVKYLYIDPETEKYMPREIFDKFSFSQM